MLVLTSVSPPPLGLYARSTRCISYPRTENLCVLLRWVSWMQQTSMFCALRNCWSSSFFCRTPSAFQCTMRSVWWPVALLCPPPAIRRESEPQSVALVGPFWGWGRGAIPPWLRPTRTTPQRSRDNCTAMLSLIRRQPIFYLRQVGCVIQFRQLRFLLRMASSPRKAALPSWRVHPTRVCVLRFHRIDKRFVFQDLRAPSARLLWPAAGCFPLPPSQLLGVASSPLPPDLLLGLGYLTYS